MNVLILGKGFIGTKLATFLRNKNVTCSIISKVDVDYSIDGNLSNVISLLNISHVVNCSGFTGKPNVDACESNKKLCWDLNVTTNNRVNITCNKLRVPVVHVSSGCIYTGYEKVYTETDYPNFGVCSDVSSYYSKCKHAFETVADLSNAAILRIRMPFTGEHEPKNYLSKILNYSNLVSYDNSFTSVDNLCDFILKFLDIFTPGIYNVVNTDPMNAKQVTEIFKKHNLVNPNWSFVDFKSLNVIANRSNCVLSTEKIKNLGLELSSTYEEVERCIAKMAKV